VSDSFGDTLLLSAPSDLLSARARNALQAEDPMIVDSFFAEFRSCTAMTLA
jgi:hypothetical protein